MTTNSHQHKREILACHDCDLVQKIPDMENMAGARCVRCGAQLLDHKKDSIDKTLALALAGLVLFTIANAFPFLSFKLEAQVRQTTLFSGIKSLYDQGWNTLALLVMLTTILTPLFHILSLLSILLPLKLGKSPRFLPRIMKLINHLQPWSMMEVFLLGILVSTVKLAKMAEIVPGTAVWAFVILIFVQAGMVASLDRHHVWKVWEKQR